ncbi:hypothetical protein [Methylovirgula sp. HY1]|uniref:hypothetical protein n=1 Tax=Methylovirgula sp. HY1 TaxID=2822761 RepID=UPI001C5ABD12|nr:hypothetical protein [Methylovirgula sp. HY1]QXX76376.1 hypothetical protein MHY1_03216 [Methylovirgula sp. HY1]
MTHKLSINDLQDGLKELGEAAANAGKIIDLAIYGGSCLMLVSNFRVASEDVDAVAATDQPFIDKIAKAIAKRKSWPQDWLNDGVKTYLSPKVDLPDAHTLFATYPSEAKPGLRVFVPTAEYMLAMKLMALRIDEISGNKDKEDITNLIKIVNIKSKADLIALAAQYYPEAKVSAKLHLAADHLIALSKTPTERHEPPEYLGRRSSGMER